jgi:hypothetical protein
MCTTQPIGELDFDLKSQAINKANLTKRARSKFLSEKLCTDLYDYACQVDSPLKRTYANSVRCCSKVCVKNGKTTSEYCKNRCCLVCARIKCAHDINNYKESYEEKMPNPYFLTLTLRNIKGLSLRNKIREMFRTWDKIRDSYRKEFKKEAGYSIIGFLKLECTYNKIEDSYHPHFHFVGEGDHFSLYARKKWISHYKCKKTGFKQAFNAYQKVVKLNIEHYEGVRNYKELQEIFKYVAEIVSGENIEDDALINAKALDTIYCAMSHIRCLRFYGLKKKQETKEEIEAIESDEAPESAEELEIFVWRTNNWYSTETGESLTDFVPSEKELNFEKMIEKGKLLRQKLM